MNRCIATRVHLLISCSTKATCEPCPWGDVNATLPRSRGDGRHAIDPILSLGRKQIDVYHVFPAHKFMRPIRRDDENHPSLHREFFAFGIHITLARDDPGDLLIVMMM